ncbi:MAG: hypothetical protein K6A14_08690 [Erysipelotrichaceae bacterium]|nr:hypothetical protein [Erysipelotrichaceae bacterium]
MEKTITLYDEDSYLRQFDAQVLSCRPGANGGYETILDRTAFFPEQGGQVGDQGHLNDVRITDTQIKDELIIHYAEKPLAEGSQVHGVIDWKRRYELMQNHTGEHILSGVICHSFNCNNVGFRLSEESCTVDYDYPLSQEQLAQVELRANEAIWANEEVLVSYPDQQQLACLEYRSKKELSGRVRIVSIPNVDICACCAPHVRRTGEVGMIKIISCEKHKSGVRLYIACGQRAYELTKENQKVNDDLVHALSTPREKLPQRIAEMNQEILRLSKELSGARIALLKEQLNRNESPVALFFGEDCLEKDIREVINEYLDAHQALLCAGFNGNDEQGYRFVMASRQTDMKQLAAGLRQKLNFQGGGSSEMIQGSVKNSRAEIESVLNGLNGQNGL